METKKQKQQKLKELCRKINIGVMFIGKKSAMLYHISESPVGTIYCYYAGNKIIRLESRSMVEKIASRMHSYHNHCYQRLYNQIFNIIQQINEN